uniref:Uncharacterized protein n=1 Tax=Candidatus Kentrum sp. DK TaxID=2126562 RepID=A0A450SSA3_9GAMM|nr:MAG: hypothetical protein BECKDK2373C_GA0170839_105516 [Candidatus Kentron sp. DK]
MTSRNSILKCTIFNRNPNHAATGIFHSFLDGRRNLPRLSSSETYLSLPVSNNCQCAETKLSPTFDHLRNTVYGYQLFQQFAFFFHTLIIHHIFNSRPEPNIDIYSVSTKTA